MAGDNLERQEVLATIGRWKKDDVKNKENRQRALVKKEENQSQLLRQKREEEKQKQLAKKLSEREEIYARYFVGLCKEFFGAHKGKLAKMDEKKLMILDEFAARKARPWAVAQVASLPLSLAGLLGFVCGLHIIASLPFSLFLLSGAFIAGGALCFASFIVSLMLFFNLNPRDEESQGFSSRKYFFVGRQFLKRIRGKDYFPYAAVKKELRKGGQSK